MVKAASGKGGLKELYDVYVYINNLGGLKDSLAGVEGIKKEWREQIDEAERTCSNIIGLAEAVIDMDKVSCSFVLPLFRFLHFYFFRSWGCDLLCVCVWV